MFGGIRNFRRESLRGVDSLSWAVAWAICLLMGLANPLSAQTRFEITPEVDRLLRDSLDKMYRYDLKSADEGFDELVRRFPNHPIGPMHKAEVVWWRALRDNKNRVLEQEFDRYTELAVNNGQGLLKENPEDFYASLYVAGAYGNRTRYNVYIKKSYYRAMRAGMKGYDFIHSAQALRKDYVDCLIGEGVYNYFAGSLPIFLRIFAGIFAKGGDRAKGIQQLELAAQKGEYGQVAAKMVLLGVYYNEKRFGDYQKLLSDLLRQFPSNPVFVMWQADYYIRQHELEQGIGQLSKLINGRKNGLRGNLMLLQAYHEKGRLEFQKRALEAAVSSLTQVIEAKPLVDPLLAKSHLLRGCAWDLKGAHESAKADYQTVLQLPETDDSHKKAKNFLNRPYQGSVKP